MKGNKVVVGVYAYVDDTIKAIRKAKEAGLDVTAYSPVPVHAIIDEIDHKRSPVAWITGTGALTGITFGFGLCILCNLDWPLRVSAKDIVSIPAFIPVGYECTILFGAIATLLAMFHFCKIPGLIRAPGYDPRFSQDKFGVVVGCDSHETESVAAGLKSCGAEEVSVQDGM